MQEHLHVGRPSWKRLGQAVLILFLAGAFPFIVGLHMRFSTTVMQSEGGKIDLYYAGFGNQQWYDIQPDQTNLITPLFLLIPFWDDGKNIHGMHWLGHVATDAPHS
jgi:hypothetical protein